MIVGQGVRLAGAEASIMGLIDALGIPVVSSWTAADMIADHHLHIGHCGIFGDRASNFAVQNADLLLVIGCRLSVPQMGYNRDTFAREAKIIMVDVDDAELHKPSLVVDLPIVSDAKEFITEMMRLLDAAPKTPDGYGWLIDKHGIACNYVLPWLNQCQGWKNKYPVVLPEYGQ
jgi:acetolactate synthase-1/2/3 large subunit